nr:zinc knuckle CX2CX4HX4C [Tanacetum cinerariifolium]
MFCRHPKPQKYLSKSINVCAFLSKKDAMRKRKTLLMFCVGGMKKTRIYEGGQAKSAANLPNDGLIYSIDDVAALFGVPLNSLKEIDEFTKDLEAGKYAVWSNSRIIDIICNSQWTSIPNQHTMFELRVEVQDQLKANSNFRPLVDDPVFDGVNIFIPRKVIEKKQLDEHGLKRIMINTKGFFFFKFDSRDGLEAVLEGSHWLIYNSQIILKKWSMDTRFLKEELTRILIWVKLHDAPIQVFKEDGISLIATFIGKPVMLDSYTSAMCNDSYGRSSFARCLIEVNSEADLVDVVTIGIPSLTGDGFTKETIHVEYEWRPPSFNVVTHTVEKSNDGFQTVGKKKKRKGKSKSTNGENEEEDEEHMENVYDESANLFPNSKIDESSSFIAAAC